MTQTFRIVETRAEADARRNDGERLALRRGVRQAERYFKGRAYSVRSDGHQEDRNGVVQATHHRASIVGPCAGPHGRRGHRRGLQCSYPVRGEALIIVAPFREETRT